MFYIYYVDAHVGFARSQCTLQDTARHCKTLQDTARHCKDTARHCNTHVRWISENSVFWTRGEGGGWLRLVGSLQLQVSFAEHRLFYRALLQKTPFILWSLLIVATPYSAAAASHATGVCMMFWRSFAASLQNTRHAATHCKHCNTLQHLAKHCNTLQHTITSTGRVERAKN